MIAVIGCNARQFDLFMEGKYDTKPEHDKQYFHVHQYKNLTGLSFDWYIDLGILNVPWDVFNELLTRLKSIQNPPTF